MSGLRPQRFKDSKYEQTFVNLLESNTKPITSRCTVIHYDAGRHPPLSQTICTVPVYKKLYNVHPSEKWQGAPSDPQGSAAFVERNDVCTVHSQLSEGPLVRELVLGLGHPNCKKTSLPQRYSERSWPKSNPNNWNLGQVDPLTSEPSDNWADTVWHSRSWTYCVQWPLWLLISQF